MLISSLAFLFADSFTDLVIASGTFGAAFTFSNGVGSAFMHETLRSLNKDDQFTDIMGRVKSLGFSIPAVIAVIVPFLITFGERAPFVISIILDIIGLVAVLSLVQPDRIKPDKCNIDNLSINESLKEGMLSGFFRLALITTIVSGSLLGLSSFRTAYQIVIEIPIIYYGIFFAIGRLLASFILFYNGKLKPYFTFKTFYLFRILSFTAMFIALGLTTHPVAVVSILILMNAFMWGFNQISTSFLIEIIGNSHYKATLFSIKSLVTHIVTFISALFFGMILEEASYGAAYGIFGMAFFAILMPLYIYCMRERN